MITRYCPSCYAANAETATACARCGSDMRDDGARTYTSGLIWALRHPEPTVAPRAAWILGRRQDRAALDPLIELARSSHDLGSLEEVSTALGKIGDPRAVPVLRDLLRDSYMTVRIRAAEALGLIGGSDAAAALRRALDDQNLSVRDAALRALETMASRRGRA